MSAGSPIHAQLSVFVDGWVDLAKLMTFTDVRTDQKAPWASISNGAAGHAYALWYVAHRRGAPASMADGRRWWRFATKGAARRSGFRGRSFSTKPLPLATSVAFGRPGLHVVEALLAHGHARPKVCRHALDRFAKAMRTVRKTPAEFMVGTAGGLTSALLLHRVTGDPSMQDLANELAHRLIAARAIPFAPFAHGCAGVQHALLAWSQITRQSLPAAITSDLAAPTDDEIVTRSPALAGSWCNGLPGFVLLWTRAYEVTGDEVWRARARGAVRRLRELPANANGTLCCGIGGQAYAALALARIDSSEDWRAYATDLCTRALGQTGVHGLLQGLSGLACLAVDLITPGEARFPLVEP